MPTNLDGALWAYDVGVVDHPCGQPQGLALQRTPNVSLVTRFMQPVAKLFHLMRTGVRFPAEYAVQGDRRAGPGYCHVFEP